MKTMKNLENFASRFNRFISHPEKSITTKHIYMYIKREKKRVVIWKNISWPKKRGADKIAGP